MAERRKPAGDGRQGGGRSGGERGGSGRPSSGGRSGSAGGGRGAGGRGAGGGAGKSSGDRKQRPDGERGGKPAGDRRTGGGEGRGGYRGKAPERGDNYRGRSSGSDRRDGGYQRRDSEDRTVDQQVYDGPPIPDDVAAKDLDKFSLRALSGLPDKLVDRIARHLVMAGLLLQDDPETAHKHALAARARATRNPMVREAVGETAYAAGNFAEALSEFRAAKRMNGAYYYVPMMADCERALGRPEKAIKMDTSEARAKLDEAGQIELTIVVAGARRDIGQADAAIRLLETEPLHTKGRADWVARLRYAYADALLDAGRRDEAVEWFHRTVAVDSDNATDAEERLAGLV